MPTLAVLTGAQLPDYEIDGKDVWGLITGENTENPHDYYAFHFNQQLEGVFSGDGKWKLILPHNYRTVESGGIDGAAGVYKYLRIEEPLLFDMVHDPFEKINVIDEYPEVARQLLEYARQHQAKFFD